jgi:hypothetical protein
LLTSKRNNKHAVETTIGSDFSSFLNHDECKDYFRLDAAWFPYYPSNEEPYQIWYKISKLEKRSVIRLTEAVGLRVRPITLRLLENDGIGSQRL